MASAEDDHPMPDPQPNERAQIRKATLLSRKGRHQEALRALDGAASEGAVALRETIVARVREQIEQQVGGSPTPLPDPHPARPQPYRRPTPEAHAEPRPVTRVRTTVPRRRPRVPLPARTPADEQDFLFFARWRGLPMFLIMLGLALAFREPTALNDIARGWRYIVASVGGWFGG